MLTQLSIRNVVLIEKLDITLDSGFLVLTGETGAGKSILLDALGLGLGERSEGSLVRSGAAQASVTLTFEPPKKHAVFCLLEELGLAESEGHAIILRRTVGQDGRSRAFINDAPVAVAALRRVGETLIEIHGQFETHGLLRRETHLGFLDAFGGIEEKVAELRRLYQHWRAAETAHDAATKMAEDATRHADDIRLSLDELTRLAPMAGEAEKLADMRTRLQAHEKIMESLQAAQQDMQGDTGAVKRLASVRRILSRAAEKAPTLLAPLLEQIDKAEESLAEAAAQLEDMGARAEYNPAELEKIEERLFTLRAAARKYRCLVDDLPALQEKLENEYTLIGDAGAQLAFLEKEAVKARQAFVDFAEQLHAAREKAARSLEAAVAGELPPLKLERAQFLVSLTRVPLEKAGPDGLSDVCFTAATNAGIPPAPLHKIASGGELARFMLALRLCLAAGNDMSLVFDEVDSGIGGATAAAVGERLARLGQRQQTIAITHNPQVAARAGTHWHIEKSVSSGQTHTQAHLLEGSERQEEIARMLSGAVVTDAAREAASSLLAQGQDKPLARKRKAL